MKRFLLMVITGVFLFPGCQTLGIKMTDEHAQSHSIEIEFNEKSKKTVRYVDIIHRLKDGQVYLAISGSVRRPFGTFASRMTVNVKFMDTKGQIVFNKNQGVLLRRMGGRTQRRYEGSFFIQAPDNPDIVKCTVEI